MRKNDLKIGWATHDACKYAVEKWHYSKTMPVAPIVKIGVWEHGKFIGCVLFSRGACRHLMTPYGLKQEDGCELTRVALAEHKTPVSRIIAISIRKLKQLSPELKLIVSFADPKYGHHGGIYQAGGWIYCGESDKGVEYRHRGRRYHSRYVSSKGWTTIYGKRVKVLKPSECEIIPLQGKHRYLMPLNKEMAKRIKHLKKPYPKRQPVEGRGNPAPERRCKSDPGAPSFNAD